MATPLRKWLSGRKAWVLEGHRCPFGVQRLGSSRPNAGLLFILPRAVGKAYSTWVPTRDAAAVSP